MKTKIIMIALILATTLFYNCSNDDDDNNLDFNAVVLKQGSSCGFDDNDADTIDYLIEFNENITDLPIENTRIYYAANLPEAFKKEGLEINITYRDLNEDELVICTTLQETIPFIYVLTVE